MAGPLDGVRVLELGGIGAVPFCAMLLADLGADVVRMDRPDAGRSPNPVLDRGRPVLRVNLKHPRGIELVRSLARGSDALIEGFRPGVLERLGLAPATLRQDNPRLVVGRMTGFGQDGPLALRAGHDINYIALSGALAAIGRAGGPPVPPINLLGDFGGGGMLLGVGVLAAILKARSSGRGQDVDVAMVEGSGLLMSMMFGFLAQGTWSLERGTNRLDTGAPFYDVYACADGRHVAVGAIEPQFFAALVDVLGVHAEIDLARQNDRETWPHQREVFARVFATAPREEWERRFEGVDACVTPVLDMSEISDHPHNRARGAFRRDATGVIHPTAPRFSGTPIEPVATTPGHDTTAILRELGHTAADIDALRLEGVLP